jgi:hypothetical protein
MSSSSKQAERERERESRKHVTRRSIDWKLVDYVTEPLHARLDFTLEGCANDEDLDLHGDLSHCSPRDLIMERDLFEERVFLNPPWEWAQHIGHHFENCRRAAPTSTMGAFVLSKWAKFNKLSRHWKFYQEFLARTQVFTRESLDDPTKQEVACSNPLACSTLVSRCLFCFLRSSPDYNS